MKKMIPAWIRAQLPKGTISQYFDSSSGRVHYLSRGKGRQVVLVHGNPTWSFLWRRVLNELDPERYEVLAPDLMNLGFSDDLRGQDFNVENLVKPLAEFYKSHLRKGAVLVVQDWGGPIGLLAASQCRDLFGGFVVLNTGVSAPEFPMRLSWFHKLSNTPILAELLFGVLGFPMRTLHKVQYDAGSIAGDVARAYRYPIGLGRRTVALKFARLVPSFPEHPAVSQFERLESFCRTLKNVEVVWGVKDPILGKRLKRTKEVLRPDRVTEVDAGHFLQEEAYQEIAMAVERVCAGAELGHQSSRPET